MGVYLKNIDNKMFPEARLVAKGFEENNKDIPKDSPTCSKEVLCTMLALTAQKQWKLNATDIKAAFLQGDEIMKLIYGLGDASRNGIIVSKPIFCQ